MSQPESLEQLAGSVGVGVIAWWLNDNTDVPDPLAAAAQLIAAMTAAGLITFLKTDLDQYLNELRAELRAARWGGDVS